MNLKIGALISFLIVFGFAFSEPETALVPEPNYMGQKVSFNFQDIPVRSVLQTLSGFMGKNVVISEAVKGNITLHLKDVPWDQVLDFILSTQGLGKRELNNIILIAPAADIAAQEQADLQSKEALNALQPLYTRSFTINYGKVDEYFNLLKDPQQTLLSSKGRVVRLNSSNTLIVEDTADKLQSIEKLFSQMDKPAKQVLIETRIVYLNTQAERQLGVKWTSQGGGVFKGFNMDLSPGGVATGSTGGGSGIGALSFGTVVKGLNLGLELQAIEAAGQGELVSSPRILTSNNTKASIEQGQQYPYSSQAASGGTTVQFVSAVLRLEVTPQITPNNKLLLDLTVNQDQINTTQVSASQQPPIDTRRLQTMIMVDNGQTIVLGGIYQYQNQSRTIGVPFLSQIPLIGNLFKSKTNTNTKTELLVFMTPHIQDLSTQQNNTEKVNA